MNIVFYILDTKEEPLKIDGHTPKFFASEQNAEDYILRNMKRIRSLYGYTTLKVEKRYLIL